MFWLKLCKNLGLVSRNKYKKLALHKRLRDSKLFNEKWYLNNYLDVADAGVNPIEHYLQYGWSEGRNPSELFNTVAYLQDNPDVANSKMCPLLHYLDFGYAEGRSIRNVYGGVSNVKLSIHKTFRECAKNAFTYPIRIREEYDNLRTQIHSVNK